MRKSQLGGGHVLQALGLGTPGFGPSNTWLLSVARDKGFASQGLHFSVSKEAAGWITVLLVGR